MLSAALGHVSAVTTAGVFVGGTFMVIARAGVRGAHRVAGEQNAQPLIAAISAAFAIGQVHGPVFAGWVFVMTRSFTCSLLFGSFVLISTLIPMTRHSDQLHSRHPDD